MQLSQYFNRSTHLRLNVVKKNSWQCAKGFLGIKMCASNSRQQKVFLQDPLISAQSKLAPVGDATLTDVA